MDRQGVTIKWMVFIIGFVFLLISNPASGQLSKDPVKLGLFQPATGQTANYGIDTLATAKWMEEMINSQGGVFDNRPVKIYFEDDKGTIEGGVTAVKKLITQDKVHAILGSSLSSLTLAAKAITAQYEILHMVPGAKHPDITMKRDHKYLFRINTTQDQDIQGFMAMFDNHLKPKRVAILYDQLDYGVYWKTILEKELKKKGIEIVGIEQVPFETSDFNVQITKFKAAKPDTVCIPITSQAGTAAFMKQMDDLKLSAVKVPMCGGMDDALVKMAGKSCEDSWWVDVYVDSLDNPVNKVFVENIKKMAGKPPNKIHLLGYDSINVVVQGMKIARSTDSAKVAAAIRTGSFDSPRGVKLTFDETGQVQSQLIPLTVKNGKIVPRRF